MGCTYVIVSDDCKVVQPLPESALQGLRGSGYARWTTTYIASSLALMHHQASACPPGTRDSEDGSDMRNNLAPVVMMLQSHSYGVSIDHRNYVHSIRIAVWLERVNL
jgi:hypothetical protein